MKVRSKRPIAAPPDILIYTMGHCPYRKRAKALLKVKGLTFWSPRPRRIQRMVCGAIVRLTHKACREHTEPVAVHQAHYWPVSTRPQRSLPDDRVD